MWHSPDIIKALGNRLNVTWMSRVSRLAISKQIALKDRIYFLARVNWKIAVRHSKDVCCLSNAVRHVIALVGELSKAELQRSFSGRWCHNSRRADESFCCGFHLIRSLAENTTFYIRLASWTKQISKNTSIPSRRIKRENAFWMIKVEYWIFRVIRLYLYYSKSGRVARGQNSYIVCVFVAVARVAAKPTVERKSLKISVKWQNQLCTKTAHFALICS